MKIFINAKALTSKTQSKILQFFIDSSDKNMLDLLVFEEVEKILKEKGIDFDKNIDVKFSLLDMKWYFTQDE